MVTKIAILLSIFYLALQAQDTSSYPDTSQYPDTSTYPDTSQYPDTSMNPDTSQYEEIFGNSDTSQYPDTATNPDTSQCPDTSMNPDTLQYQGTSGNSDTTQYPDTSTNPDTSEYEYPDTSNGADTSQYEGTLYDPEPAPYPEATEYPDSSGAADELQNSSNIEEVQNDTIITSSYYESDGSENPYSVQSGMCIGVGVGVFYNLSEDNPAFQAFISRVWGLGSYFAVNLIGEGATDFDDSWFVDGGLRLDLYPLPAYTVISPYFGIGAGIGWGTVTNEDKDALGVNLNGTVGFRLFKDLPVGLTIEANVDWLLNHVTDGNPVVLMGRVGIAF